MIRTNVLSIPKVRVIVVTGTNEDWIESICYLLGDTEKQLDLRGIRFEMSVRRRAEDHEVILHATSKNRWLSVAPFPNTGFLLLNVPLAEMRTKLPGNYVADIVARNGVFNRRIIEMELQIVQGVTRYVEGLATRVTLLPRATLLPPGKVA